MTIKLERHWSRRSAVVAPEGMVVCSQPLAVAAGLDVLRRGGNAVDAAVAAAAVLTVVEPMSTGLGGDAFGLFYRADTQDVSALNGSGRAPRGLAELAKRRGWRTIPLDGVSSLTVPGLVDGWGECLRRHGSWSWDRVLQPAIDYAERGFPLTPTTAQLWQRAAGKLGRDPDSRRCYLPRSGAPGPGASFVNRSLGRTLRRLAEKGPRELYEGELARDLVASLKKKGGVLAEEDLAAHRCEWTEPLRSSYRSHEVLVPPPNGQGLIALVALKLLEQFDLSRLRHHSVTHLHRLIEAVKIGFSFGEAYIADPGSVPAAGELLRELAATAPRIRPRQARSVNVPISAPATVYVAVADPRGNLVSFINSIFKHFGSGVTAGSTGIVMNNRASGFSLTPGHPNVLEAGKRPFHTIVPAMMFRNRRPWAVLGVVGGSMQPQGLAQVISNLVDFGMDPQSALDAPRFRFLGGLRVALEETFPRGLGRQLRALGHRAAEGMSSLKVGAGQLIVREGDAYWGASDSRRDGIATGF